MALDLDVYIAARTAPELSYPCRACDVYAKSWPTECCYCKRVYGINKRNQKSLGTSKKIREAA